MLGPQLMEQLGKDEEVWPCWRRCGTGLWALRVQKPTPFPVCVHPLSLPPPVWASSLWVST